MVCVPTSGVPNLEVSVSPSSSKTLQSRQGTIPGSSRRTSRLDGLGCVLEDHFERD